MKKIFFLLIFLFLVPISVSAANTFNLDFDLKDNYPLIMEKGDRILFEYGGYNHTIIVDDIKKSNIELDLFLFLEWGPHTPNYLYLNKDYNVRIDFDRDQKKELAIEYVDIDFENKRATLVFRKLEAWNNNVQLIPFWESEKIDEQFNEGIDNKYLFWGIGLFILIVLIIIFINKRQKGIYF